MRKGATYAPAIKERPLLSINMHTGLVRRYIRVLYAGVGERYVEVGHWELQIDGQTYKQADVRFDLEMLDDLRKVGA
jgi:hypothetical protein